MKRVMVVLDLDENNNAEVVFTKELIQNKEDFEECDVVGWLGFSVVKLALKRNLQASSYIYLSQKQRP